MTIEEKKNGFKLTLTKPLLAASGKPAQYTDSPDEGPRDATVRDYFLLLLSAQGGLSPKEAMILKELTFQIGDEKEVEIELSVKRLDLLRKITKESKTNRGEPLFNALAQAQLLESLGLSEEDL